MTNETKARGIQLIRTDDSTPGLVKFYDRRQTAVALAFIAQVDVTMIPDDQGDTLTDAGFSAKHPIVSAARHGITQNLLDSSNKLEGDARVDFIRQQCKVVQSGGWASAPVDSAKLVENAKSAILKLHAAGALTDAMRDTMLAGIPS